MTSQPRLRAGVLRRVPEIIDLLGVTPDPLLVRAGFDIDVERWTDRCVHVVQALSLLDLAADVTGEREFGARFGSRTTVELGQLAAILMAPGLLGRSILMAAARENELREGVAHILLVDGSHAEIREILAETRETAAHVQLVDASLGAILAILRLRLGGEFCPDLVRLPPGRGRSVARLEQILGAPVAFDGERPPAIVLPSRLVDTPTGLAGPTAPIGGIVPYSEPKAASDLAESCRLILSGMIDLCQRPSLQKVGETLGMPARTVQWRLDRAGFSFHALRDEVMRERAVELLTERGLSVTEVAVTLGYGNVANFVRAFRKWFGTSPGRFRRVPARAAGAHSRGAEAMLPGHRQARTAADPLRKMTSTGLELVLSPALPAGPARITD